MRSHCIDWSADVYREQRKPAGLFSCFYCCSSVQAVGGDRFVAGPCVISLLGGFVRFVRFVRFVDFVDFGRVA